MRRFVKTRLCLTNFISFFGSALLFIVGPAIVCSQTQTAYLSPDSSNQSVSDSIGVRPFLSQNQVLVHFNFDEPGNLQDLSGFNNESKLRPSKKTGTSAWVTGLFGYGLRSNPEMGGFEVTLPKSVPGTSSFSLLFWIKPESFTGEQSLTRVVSTKTKNSLVLSVREGVLQASFLNSTHAVPAIPALIESRLGLKEWQQVVVTVDSSAAEMVLYLNGKKVGSAKIQTTGTEKNSERDITVGFENENNARFFDGVFDEWTMFEGVLSVEDISFLDRQGRGDLLHPSESKKQIGDQEKKLEIYLPLDQIKGSYAESHVVASCVGVLSGLNNDSNRAETSGLSWCQGVKGGGLSWSQGGDRVDIERYSPATFKDDFTVCLWVNPKSFGPKRKVFSTFRPDSSDTFFVLGLDNKQFYSAVGNQSEFNVIRSAQEVLEEHWQHVALVFNRKQKVFEIYQDGVRTASEPITIQIPVLQFPLTIGAGLLENSDSFQGSLDEVKVYSRVLSASEITEEVAVLKADPKKLCCYLNFDQDSPLWVHDLSLANHRGQVLNVPAPIFTEGHSGNGINFKKKSGALVLPSSHYFDNLEQFTLSAWLKPHSFGEKRKIFSRHQSEKPKGFVILGEDDGFLYFAIGDPKNYKLTKLKAPLVQNVWQHIALSFKQKSGEICFYLDGKPVLEEKTTSAYSIVSGVETTLGSDFKGQEAFWDGAMDDFAFFATALSPEDISKLPLTSNFLTQPATSKLGSESLSSNNLSSGKESEVPDKIASSASSSVQSPVSSPGPTQPLATQPEKKSAAIINSPVTNSPEVGIPAKKSDLKEIANSAVLPATKIVDSRLVDSSGDSSVEEKALQSPILATPEAQIGKKLSEAPEALLSTESAIVPQKTKKAIVPKKISSNTHPLANISSLLEGYRKNAHDWQQKHNESKHPLLLNKVPFFKQNGLFAFFNFEGKEKEVFQDDLSSDVELNFNSAAPGHCSLLGFNGLGLYLDGLSNLNFSPVKMTIPRVFSLQFSVLPLDLPFEGESVSLLRFLSSDSKEIVRFDVVEDRLFLVSSTSGQNFDTQIVLMTGGWQDLILSYDAEEKAFYIHKNGAFLKKIVYEGVIPPKLIVSFGRSENNNSSPFILDEVRFYRHAFKEATLFPKAPSNSAATIKEGPVVTMPELTLLLYSEGATEVSVSTHEDFVDARWVPFRNELTTSASLVTGVHTLYCKFRNKEMMESDTVSVGYQWVGQSKEIQFTNPVPESTIAGSR